MEKKAKTWEICVNNWTQEDVDLIKRWEYNKALIAAEVGTEGTPHLQGRITFKRAYRLVALKKLISRAHWEPSKATADSNYFRKEGSEIIIDEDNGKQGKRTDIEVIREGVREKRTWLEIADQCSSVQSLKAIETYQTKSLQARALDTNVRVYWFWGATGTGKTRWVWEHETEVYVPVSYKWWQGYTGQKVVLIDDFRGSWCLFSELLKLLDRYPIQVETKGGSVHLQVEKWYITSCYHPENVYKEREDINQLLRRLTEVRRFTQPEFGTEDGTGTEVGVGNTETPTLVPNRMLLDIDFENDRFP